MRSTIVLEVRLVGEGLIPSGHRGNLDVWGTPPQVQAIELGEASNGPSNSTVAAHGDNPRSAGKEEAANGHVRNKATPVLLIAPALVTLICSGFLAEAYTSAG
jgi:hypothetical protein